MSDACLICTFGHKCNLATEQVQVTGSAKWDQATLLCHHMPAKSGYLLSHQAGVPGTVLLYFCISCSPGSTFSMLQAAPHSPRKICPLGPPGYAWLLSQCLGIPDTRSFITMTCESLRSHSLAISCMVNKICNSDMICHFGKLLVKGKGKDIVKKKVENIISILNQGEAAKDSRRSSMQHGCFAQAAVEEGCITSKVWPIPSSSRLL